MLLFSSRPSKLAKRANQRRLICPKRVWSRSLILPSCVECPNDWVCVVSKQLSNASCGMSECVMPLPLTAISVTWRAKVPNHLQLGAKPVLPRLDATVMVPVLWNMPSGISVMLFPWMSRTLNSVSPAKSEGMSCVRFLSTKRIDRRQPTQFASDASAVAAMVRVAPEVEQGSVLYTPL